MSEAGISPIRDQPPPADAYRAVETIYHAYLTGLILLVITRRGAATAAELVFRTFRRQHLERFLPGLEKLGLRSLPDAVACAQYHYLSNALGGVRVEYAYESDRKAWVRYPPPRWIWEGTAICGIPSEVTRAMLRGWHAHNGVSLGNPRLGFVCTKMTTDGEPGLEGYFLEYDRDLAPEEHLQFSPGEDAPDFDPIHAPRVDGGAWPPERLQKVLRNFAMDYVRTILPELVATLGPADARDLGGLAGRLIGMQHYPLTADLLGVTGVGPREFADYLVRMGRAQGDAMDAEEVEGEIIVRQRSWHLMAGAPDLSPAVFEAWASLWHGALAVHNRRLTLAVTRRLDRDRETFEWHVRAPRRPAACAPSPS